MREALLVACSLPLAVSSTPGQTAVAGSFEQVVHFDPPSNVLLVIADDFGIDQLASYGVGQQVADTPTLDALAVGGLLFRNAWANPLCSPTRAAIQTGRHGFRTGIGYAVLPGFSALALAEVTIPELLDAGTGGVWQHALIGKWHLGNDDVGGPLNPNLQGYNHFSGALDNIEDYFFWIKTVDGVSELTTRYATSDQVNDTLTWTATAQEPWFCVLSFSAPHHPFHAPPDELTDIDLRGLNPHTTPKPFYNAMVEAMDTELGRLLAEMDPALRARTTVFFIGDNGSVKGSIVPPFEESKAKFTLYQGGVRVPLIANGPLVECPGRQIESFVHATDFFATVAEIAGIDPHAVLPVGTKLDSRTLMPFLRNDPEPPERHRLFSEVFAPNDFSACTELALAMRDARFKLILDESKPDQLYDLLLDPFETVDLAAAGFPTPGSQLAYERLSLAILELVANP